MSLSVHPTLALTALTRANHQQIVLVAIVGPACHKSHLSFPHGNLPLGGMVFIIHVPVASASPTGEPQGRCKGVSYRLHFLESVPCI